MPHLKKATQPSQSRTSPSLFSGCELPPPVLRALRLDRTGAPWPGRCLSSCARGGGPDLWNTVNLSEGLCCVQALPEPCLHMWHAAVHAGSDLSFPVTEQAVD